MSWGEKVLADADNRGIDLPSWIFDVDEDDEDLSASGKTLLQELEIDPDHIYKNIVWMLVGPCFRLTGRANKRHPLYMSTSNSHRQSIDFWGPCSIMSAYILVLWLGRVKDVSWIFVIWTLAAVVNHMVCRVFYHSKLLIHVALLGYCIAPMIPVAIIILLFSPPAWLSSCIQIVGILWASTSGILSYSTIFSLASELRPRLRLLFPTVVLMTMYISCLVPTSRR